MGLFDDYERMRDERNREGARRLVEHFGGPDGCLKIVFFPITIPYYFLRYGFVPLIQILFLILYSLVLIVFSLLILTPLKIVVFLISFGRWNGFENSTLSERLEDLWD